MEHRLCLRGASEVPGYHTDKTDRQVIIIHSWITGSSKPICESRQYLLGLAAAHAFLSKNEAQHIDLSTLPLYHVDSSRFLTLKRHATRVSWRSNRFSGKSMLTRCIQLNLWCPSKGIETSLCLPISPVSCGGAMAESLELAKPSLLMTVPSVSEDIAFLEYGVGIKTSRGPYGSSHSVTFC